MPITSKFGHYTVPITTATGSYSVGVRDFGACIETTGATTITLPTPAIHIAGIWVQIYAIGAGDLTITAGAGKIVTFNNATAASIAFSTDTQEIGSSVLMLCDGTSWLPFIDLNQSDQAVTVA